MASSAGMRKVGHVAGIAWSAGGKVAVVARAKLVGPTKALVFDSTNRFAPISADELDLSQAQARFWTWFDGEELVVGRAQKDKPDIELATTEGKVRFRSPTKATVKLANAPCAAGILSDGSLWALDWRGGLGFFDAKGQPMRELALKCNCIDLVVSPDDEHALVLVDLLNFKSTARAIDLKTGATVWEVTATAPPAAKAGPVTARAGKLEIKGAKRPLGTFSGEVADLMMAISKDKALLLVADDSALRLFDLDAKKALRTLTSDEVESATIDPIDKVLFDRKGRPAVVVGRHTFVWDQDGLTPP